MNTKRTRGTITFILRKSTKAEKPISLSYSYGRGKRFVYAIGHSVNPKYWDKEKFRVRNVVAVRDSKSINKVIRDFESVLSDFVVDCDTKQVSLSNDLLKNHLNTYTNKYDIDEEMEDITLFSFINSYIKRKEKELPKPKNGRKNQTVKSYEQTLRHLKEFSEDVGYDLDFETVDEEFYAEFVDYMSNKTYGKGNYYHLNTIGKHVKNFKIFMNDALHMELHTNIKFKRFKVLTEITTAIYLNLDEQKMMLETELKKPHLVHARDVFLIGCEIGQRISDYHNLRSQTIVRVNDEKFIQIRQEKTSKDVLCNITPVVQKIMDDRYEGQMPPKITEQKLNDYIKIVGEKAGLDEEVKVESTVGGKLTVNYVPKYNLIMGHSARRSFCTNKYKAGMPVNDIMQLSGHTTEREFMKYIRNPKEERISQITSTEAFKKASIAI
ncbi:MAG: site-specific integrase [Winogradskyella sp.]